MSRDSSVYDCTIITLDKHQHEKGNITVVQNCKDVPFEVERIFYLYDIPGGESRGEHAHFKCEQLLVAVSGSFDVTIDDAGVKRTFTLNRPYHGLYIKTGIWCELDNFSSGSVCMVLASAKYDEADYIRDYDKFRRYKADE